MKKIGGMFYYEPCKVAENGYFERVCPPDGDLAFTMSGRCGLYYCLEDIMLQLQRWYDIEVFFASENLKNKTFTGVVRRDLVAREIFSIIEKTTRVKFEENGKCVIISYQ